eukprot:6069678-Prymnesium_polylepis.1
MCIRDRWWAVGDARWSVGGGQWDIRFRRKASRTPQASHALSHRIIAHPISPFSGCSCSRATPAGCATPTSVDAARPTSRGPCTSALASRASLAGARASSTGPR